MISLNKNRKKAYSSKCEAIFCMVCGFADFLFCHKYVNLNCKKKKEKLKKNLIVSNKSFKLLVS